MGAAAFLPQIDDDQVGSLAAHLPHHAQLDLNLDGKHLTAQINYDQKVGADGFRSAQMFEIVGRDGNVDPPEAVEFQIFGAPAHFTGRELVGYDADLAPEAVNFEIGGEPAHFDGQQIVGGEYVGGFFNSITKKLGFNRKLEKKIEHDTGRKVTIRINNPTPKDIGRGLLKTAKIAGAVASLAVPGLGLAGAAALAAPGALSAGRSLLSAGKTVSGAAHTVAKTGAAARAQLHAAGVAVAADKLVAAAERGGAAARTASHVVRQTRQLAARGNPDARVAEKILNQVAVQRRAAAIPKGREQPVTAKGAEALRAFAEAPKPTAVLAEKPGAQGRKGWFISTEPETYGRIDFSQGLQGRWKPA